MTRLDVAIVATALGFAAGVWTTNKHVAPNSPPPSVKTSQIIPSGCDTDHILCWTDRVFVPEYSVSVEDMLKAALEDQHAEVR